MPVGYAEGQGRHLHVPQGPSLWKCPACSAEQSGPIEQGCQACGSGQPGKHVGVDPIVRAGQQNSEQALNPAVAQIAENRLKDAFIGWFRPMRGQYDAATEELLFLAFRAGYQVGASQVAQMEPALTGTAESRTIITALRLYLDQMLPNVGEEIARGELLGRLEVEHLIRKLERVS